MSSSITIPDWVRARQRRGRFRELSAATLKRFAITEGKPQETTLGPSFLTKMDVDASEAKQSTRSQQDSQSDLLL
jgi:hypothetical protein